MTAVYEAQARCEDIWETLLDSMLRIRYFENEVKALFGSGLVRGSTHLCQGQEATVVGACSRLRPGDMMASTYRGHGAVLATGASPTAAFAEILGRDPGLCGGKGGSMHFTDLTHGAIGSNAIVGAHLPIAVGAAFGAQHLKSGAVSLAFTGDGSTNIGAFHEALNLAGIWKLPVVIVIENNHYGEYSPLAATTPISALVDRAKSYGIRGEVVDGNDVLAVRNVVGEAFDRARDGNGPTLIEADTYRFEGHSRSDPGKYRPPGELESWLARDPIERFADLLKEREIAGTEIVEAHRQQVGAEIAAALQAAKAAPEPQPERLYEDVIG
ncbi:MAG: thiamine pyrophosphate-dependent dehydrogenase E1 component subunit alpha [Actinomycetota bacterium]|nr:thiamine pyrophosphate-dependent dehydrogenase E1 component subunit alpha [Actinomycetota bacterium]